VPRKGITEVEVFDIGAVKEKFGILPYKIPLFKALAGDSSDNIKGIEGIGKSSAVEILRNIDHVDELITNIQYLPNRIRVKLEGKEDEVRENLFLATLKRDVPVEIDLNDIAVRDPDLDKVKSIAQELGMKSILKRFSIETPDYNHNTGTAAEKKGIKDILDIIDSSSYLSLFSDLDLSIYPVKLKSISISIEDKTYRLDEDVDVLKNFIRDLFSERRTIAVYDMKSLWKALGIYERELTSEILDVLILGYLIDPSQEVSLNKLSDRYLGMNLPESCVIYMLCLILKEEIDKNDMN